MTEQFKSALTNNSKKMSKKSPNLCSLYLQQYIQTILNTLKSLSFHELYMQKQREDLCKTQLYDPITAFKQIDVFKHNKIVGFELRAFLNRVGGFWEGQQRDKDREMERGLGEGECWEVLKCVDKSISAVGFQEFQEITLPRNVVLRNLSLGRYNNIEVKVGTMGKVYDIKTTSSNKIAGFFMKEIEYYRQLLLRKQNFCQKYGGDLYTFSQMICKGKSNKISFDQFYDFCRNYKFYFNQEEFIAIYRRTKSVQHTSPLVYDDISSIQIELESLAHCLLASAQQLDIKNRIKIISGNPINPPCQPSYKTPIKPLHQHQSIQSKHAQTKTFLNSLQQTSQIDHRDIRYHYRYPQMQMQNRQVMELREMQRKWDEDVGVMGDGEIQIRYRIIDHRRYFV